MQPPEIMLCLTVVLLVTWTLGGKDSSWEGGPKVDPGSKVVSWGIILEMGMILFVKR